jgi:hypothetical protein
LLPFASLPNFRCGPMHWVNLKLTVRNYVDVQKY